MSTSSSGCTYAAYTLGCDKRGGGRKRGMLSLRILDLGTVNVLEGLLDECALESPLYVGACTSEESVEGLPSPSQICISFLSTPGFSSHKKGTNANVEEAEEAALKLSSEDDGAESGEEGGEDGEEEEV